MALPPQIIRQLQALGVATGEIEERFVLGSGPGGQKINKTASTVWLRHRPTGIEVRCQQGRSQAANREQAWAELAGKIEALRRKAADVVRAEREKTRRRKRQKSPGQKARMIESKKHRAKIKRMRKGGQDE